MSADGPIAYESNSSRGGNLNLYVMQADNTGTVTQLTNSGSPNVTASWSPNGDQLAFASYLSGSGTSDIWTMLKDGSQTKNLTNSSPPVGNDYPSWSPTLPNGTRKIAFASNRDNLVYPYDLLNIYVMNVDGTGIQRLTNSSCCQGDENPAWSPDGTKIAFDSDRGGYGQIYVMNADGSNPVPLTTSQGPPYLQSLRPNWSPDGTKIVFDTNRDTTFWAVYVMNSDGSNQTRLTTGPASVYDQGAKWTADGTKIVFYSNRDNPQATPQVFQLYVMNADGTNQTRLTNDKASDTSPDCVRCARMGTFAP